MLINADASQLEWRCIAHLANDLTAIEEILNGVKFHKENQKKFGLPPGSEGYLIAKVFLFRAIYKGSAYAYSVDPDFAHIGGERFWQGIIDKFYEKYTGIYNYHNSIIQHVVETGSLEVETSRRYDFTPRMLRGEYRYPETDICNYPVQGLAADIMAIIRVILRRLLRINPQFAGKPLYKLVNTVHDSIVVDMPTQGWYNMVLMIDEAFKLASEEYQKLFGMPLKVPMACEIKVGCNWKWVHSIVVK